MKKAALSLVVVAASAAYVWGQAGDRANEDILGTALEADPLQTGAIPPTVLTGVTEPTVTPPAVIDRPAARSDKRETIIPAAAFDRSEPPPLPPPPTSAEAAVLTRPKPPEPAPDVPEEPKTVLVEVPTPRPRPPHTYHAPQTARAVPASDRHVSHDSLVVPAAMRVASGGGFADGVYNGPVVDAYYGYIQIQAIVQGGRLVGIKVLRYPNDRRTSVFINRQALPMLRDEVVRAQSAHVDIISGATLTSRAFIRSLGSALSQAGA